MDTLITAQWEWLPLATFGMFSLLSGWLQSFLPDLTDVPMFLYVEDQLRYYSKVSIFRLSMESREKYFIKS